MPERNVSAFRDAQQPWLNHNSNHHNSQQEQQHSVILFTKRLNDITEGFAEERVERTPSWRMNDVLGVFCDRTVPLPACCFIATEARPPMFVCGDVVIVFKFTDYIRGTDTAVFCVANRAAPALQTTVWSSIAAALVPLGRFTLDGVVNAFGWTDAELRERSCAHFVPLYGNPACEGFWVELELLVDYFRAHGNLLG